MVLVAAEQPEEDYQDHRHLLPGDPVALATIGEAFDQLLALRRIMGAYQEKVRADWLDL
jgi:hypothetical protein